MRIRLMIGRLLIMCLAVLAGLPVLSAGAESTHVTMGGKGISGPCFPTAGTIATSVNKTRPIHGFRVTVTSRRESVSVINAVMSGDFDFAVAHRRRIFQACKGLGEWEGRPQTGLRSVFTVQAEQVALITLAGSGIRTIRDLEGRRVFIGGVRSDLRDTVMDILGAAGIDALRGIRATGAAAEEAPQLILDDSIDAFFYLMGTTNRAFWELVSTPRAVRLVPVTGPGIDEMTATNPFYEKSTISPEHVPYVANTSDVDTIGVKAGLVTAARVPDKTVYTVIREVFNRVDDFKKRQPAAAVMTRAAMAEGMVAPIHPGADTFYRQSGIAHSLLRP